MVLCALETYPYPHTVLRKEGAAHLPTSVRLRFGRGAAHVNRRRLLRYVSEPERMSNQSAGLRVNGLCARMRSRRTAPDMLEHAYPGASRRHPVRRRAHPLRSFLTLENGLHIERRCALSHVIDGPGELRGEDRQRLALARFFLQAGQICLPLGIVAEAQHRRFREGPRELRIADLHA